MIEADAFKNQVDHSGRSPAADFDVTGGNSDSGLPTDGGGDCGEARMENGGDGGAVSLAPRRAPNPRDSAPGLGSGKEGCSAEN